MKTPCGQTVTAIHAAIYDIAISGVHSGQWGVVIFFQPPRGGVKTPPQLKGDTVPTQCNFF